MTIPMIGAVSGGAPQGVTGTGYLQGVGGPASTDGSGFGASLSGALDNLQQLQATSNELSVQAVTGDLNDIHTAMIASSRAQVTLELIAGVRNKGVDAFNEIMRMQA
jgi:flagellar hook-basal body complex protein FliE